MVHIKFLNLRIDSISNSSGVYYGMNKQMQYKHSSKHNQAFGEVNGKGNVLMNTTVQLNDQDQFDTYTKQS